MPPSTVVTEREPSEENMDPRIDQMECAIRDLGYDINTHDDLIAQLGGSLFALIKATVGNNDIHETTTWANEHGLAIIEIETGDNGEI